MNLSFAALTSLAGGGVWRAWSSCYNDFSTRWIKLNSFKQQKNNKQRKQIFFFFTFFFKWITLIVCKVSLFFTIQKRKNDKYTGMAYGTTRSKNRTNQDKATAHRRLWKVSPRWSLRELCCLSPEVWLMHTFKRPFQNVTYVLYVLLFTV